MSTVNFDELRDELQRSVSNTIANTLEQFAELTKASNLNNNYRPRDELEPGKVKRKVFVARNSVLTDLFTINHFQTICHIFIAILIIFSLNVTLHDFIQTGHLMMDFKMFYWCFGKASSVVTVWGCMTIAVLLVYPAFHFWASNRDQCHGGRQETVWDVAWVAAYLTFQSLLSAYPLQIVLDEDLPTASTIVVLSEQIRYIMKVHSFVRENAAKVLGWDERGADKQSELAGFSSYLYFLFCPTLIYRDSYPRTNTVRWNYVVSNLAQMIGCTYFAYFLFSRFAVPVFRNFSSDHVTLTGFAVAVFSSMLPGTLTLLIGFFGFLHSWLNAFAEMLRFADRKFYSDWWNVGSYGSFYRTWNIVVHDWLYEYVYKDLYVLTGGRRGVAVTGVFLLSAVVHEYVLMVAFRFFFPVMFVMFAGIGFAMFFVRGKSRAMNVMMWVSLFAGMGLMMCLYSMEWYARQRCPRTGQSWADLVVPRFLACRSDNAPAHLS